MSDIAIRVQGLSKKYEITKGKSIAPSDVGLVRRSLRSLVGAGPDLRMVKESFWALKDVSFEVKKGEVLGVIGHNGAGKSTLLKVLSRITEPTSGRAEIYGRVSALLEVGTGFHGELSGRENIYLNAALLGMKRGDIGKKLDQIVEFSGVEEFIDTPVKKYSSGMYVRLAFAVAAHLEPDILIVDEVLSVGDASFQQKCLGKMEEVSRSGRTVLVVSHNLETIQSLCQSSILLHHGTIEKKADTKSVLSLYVNRAKALTEIPLRERHDRQGNGSILLSDLEILDSDEHPIKSVVSGSETIFRLHYESRTAKRLKRCAASISVHARHGAPYFRCATDLSSNAPLDLEGDGYIDIVVPQIPLSGSTYHVAVFLECNGDIIDWVDNAKQLVVINGDFYKTGTGRLVPQGWEGVGVLVPHHWRLGPNLHRSSAQSS
jgi:lipopolysaccharide transport system ATP-binding protein